MMDSRNGRRFSIEFLKSEMYTGFVCAACGATFPVPPHTTPDFEKILAGLIVDVNAHRCPETPGIPRPALERIELRKHQIE